MLLPAVRIAISDCAGHPRSLEKMQEVILELLHEYGSADDWTSKNSSKELRDRVLRKIGTQTAVLSAEAVRVALKGKRLRFDARIGSATFSEMIASGVLLNTGIEGKRSDVPKLSMLSPLLHKRRGFAKAVVARSVEHLTEQEVAVLAD